MAQAITNFPLIITQNGWIKKEQCECGGILKVKFNNVKYPGYILEWWVKYYQFKMVKDNSTIQPQTALSGLSEYLTTFASLQAQKDAPEVKTAEVAVKSAPEPERVVKAATVDNEAAPEPVAKTAVKKVATEYESKTKKA